MPTTKTFTPKIMPWLVWGIGSLFFLYQFLLQTSPSIMISGLEQAFSIDAAGIGLLSSSFFYTYLFLQVPSGILIDRFGVRRTLTVAALVCAFSAMIFASSHLLLTAVMSRMVMGLMAAPAFAAALYLAAHWFPPQRFAVVAGLTEAIGMLGGILGEVFLAMLVSHYGWKATLWGCAIAGMVVAILTWLIVRDQPEKNHLIPQKTVLKFSDILISLQKIIISPKIWMVGLFGGLLFALVTGFAGLWAVPYIQTRYGISVSAAAAASMMMFIGVSIGGPFWGWLSDRIGRRKPIMYLGTLFSLLFIFLILYVPNISLFWMHVFLLLVGFSCSVYMLCFALVREMTEKSVRGTAMGFANMLCVMFGAPILQPLIGRLLELNWGHQQDNGIHGFYLIDYQVALSVLPACFLLALLLVILIPETYCQDSYDVAPIKNRYIKPLL